jgi:hypothetical protein
MAAMLRAGAARLLSTLPSAHALPTHAATPLERIAAPSQAAFDALLASGTPFILTGARLACLDASVTAIADCAALQARWRRGEAARCRGRRRRWRRASESSLCRWNSLSAVQITATRTIRTLARACWPLLSRMCACC